MDHEKKYNEALGKVRPLYEQAKKDGNPIWSTYEFLFPQLRESEDERIRKELLNFVKSFWADHKEKLPQSSRWVTYLENLKEQKPLIKKGVKYYCIKAQKRNTDFYTYAFTVGTEYIAPENNVLIDNDGHSWDLTIQTPEWIFERFTPKESKPEWSYPYGKNETVDRLVSIAECLEMNGDCVYNGYKGDECGVFLRALAREYLCIEELVNVVQDKNLMDILYYASSDDHFPSLRKLHTLLTSYNEQKEQKPFDDTQKCLKDL